MGIFKRIEVFGDSIMKGIQLNPLNKRYRIDNHIDMEAIGHRYSLIINNNAQFGCTVTKGAKSIERFLAGGKSCDMMLMDFGGNDCNFDWEAISVSPDGEHQPNTPLNAFCDAYKNIIGAVKSMGIQPILTTLPPLEPQRFFDWFCNTLNRENVMKWLGDVGTIYRWQESYSRAVERIADETGTLIIDLRGAFLKHRRIGHLLCEDGTHPNTEGQRAISNAIMEFAEQMRFARNAPATT